MNKFFYFKNGLNLVESRGRTFRIKRENDVCYCDNVSDFLVRRRLSGIKWPPCTNFVKSFMSLQRLPNCIWVIIEFLILIFINLEQ